MIQVVGTVGYIRWKYRFFEEFASSIPPKIKKIDFSESWRVTCHVTGGQKKSKILDILKFNFFEIFFQFSSCDESRGTR